MANKYKKIVALTGAGISKASGIPTFEDAKELKSKLSVEYKAMHPAEFKKAMDTLKNAVKGKKPNDAHYALAEYDIPIITMNVDSLHKKAGSKTVYEIHGTAKNDDIVLYGQDVHHYTEAVELISSLILDVDNVKDSCFLIVGTSLETCLANDFKGFADAYGIPVKIINEDAEQKVRKFLQEHVEIG